MPEVVIRPARFADKPAVAAMLQPYLAGFAEFEHVEQDSDGRYVYPYLDFYWEDPNRYPFLLLAGDDTAGFALCRFDIDPLTGHDHMEIAEFFVDPGFRRQGIGGEAATRLWNLFPGRWMVRVLKSNLPAIPFWQQTIADYTKGRFTEQPPTTAVGGAITFTFESATRAEMPEGVEQDYLDF